MSDFIWLNGQYVQRKDAKITLFESGLLYGYGVFETIMIFNQKPFRLEEHYDRLKTSAKHIRMRVHLNLKDLQDVIARLVKLNDIKHGFVRMVASSSEEPMKSMKFSASDATLLTDSTSAKNSNTATGKGNLFTSMIVVESGPVSPEYERYRQRGGAIILYPFRRSAETPYYRHKTLAYMENLLVRLWAFKRKALEGVFINTDNYIMEGTRSTLFIVKDHKVYTPSLDSNILNGITRQVVIGLCTKNAIKVREQLLRKEDIFTADEVFLTSSLMEIMPVVMCRVANAGTIENKIIGEGLVGPTTRVLQGSFKDLLSEI